MWKKNRNKNLFDMEELAIERAFLTLKEQHRKTCPSPSHVRRCVADVRHEEEYRQHLENIRHSPLLCSTLNDRTLQRHTAVSEKTTDERTMVEKSVKYFHRSQDALEGCNAGFNRIFHSGSK